MKETISRVFFKILPIFYSFLALFFLHKNKELKFDLLFLMITSTGMTLATIITITKTNKQRTIISAIDFFWIIFSIISLANILVAKQNNTTQLDALYFFTPLIFSLALGLRMAKAFMDITGAYIDETTKNKNQIVQGWLKKYVHKR